MWTKITISKTFVALCAVIAVGTTALVSCSKEDNPSPSSLSEDTQLENVGQIADFCLAVSANGEEQTVSGNFGDSVCTWEFEDDGILYSGGLQIDNEDTIPYQVFGDTALTVRVSNVTDVELRGIAVCGNVFSGRIICGDSQIATFSCSFANGIVSNAKGLRISREKLRCLIEIGVLIASELLESNSSSQDAALQCQAHMERLAKICIEGGGTGFRVTHKHNHRDCEFVCLGN